MKKLLFFLLFPLFLHAAWDPLFSEDEDPALFEHVNVITGSLNLFLQDTVVQGAKPIPIFRTYTSAGALERTHNNHDRILKSLRGGWKIQGGWTFFPHADLLIESARKHQDFRVYLAEPNGNVIAYSYSHRESDHTIFLKPEVHAGQISGVLTARTHPKNNLLRINLKKGTATLFLPNGGKRFYKGPDFRHYDPRELHKDYYHLTSETLPSGHHLIYSYDDKEYLHQITLLNPSKTQVLTSLNIDIERAQVPFHFRVTTSDNKTLNYYGLKAKERDYIHEVHSDCRPSEKFDYSPGRKGIGARIERFSLDGKTLFTVKYHSPSSEKKEKHWAEHPEDKEFQIDKVERIEATVGIPNEVASVGYFLYERTHTDVYNHSGYLTRYHHNGERLSHIEYFAEQNRLHSILKFLWDGSNLKAKVMLDGNGQALFSKTFRYDAAGNVTEEAIWGNLTGALPGPYTLRDDGSLENAESSRKRYAYEPEFNVPLLEEEEGGLSYRYAYRQGTDLLVSKFTYGQGGMLKREFYYYNVENLLVAEVTDDGKSSDPGDVSHVNVRLYKRYDLDPILGMPRSITESYWDPHSDREHQLKKVELSYTPSSQVHTESIYDGEGIHRYTLVTEYDAQGHIISKTNPLGQISTYQYDTIGNLILANEAGSPSKATSYDSLGRPLTLRETDRAGHTKTSHSKYDPKGRLVSQTDSKGNATIQTYDIFGKCLFTQFPQIKDQDGISYNPTIQFGYDLLGNLTSTTTPRGEITQTSYNLLRKPTCIIEPDGSETQHLYHRNGTLAKTIYPDKSEIHYTYDLFERMTQKTVLSPQGQLLESESWRYSTFLLEEHTDPRGLRTHYTYDGAGRKTAETAEGRTKSYLYDPLGFLERSTEGEVSHIQKHNPLGFITEEWIEDTSGHLENRMHFFYNSDNRKEKAIRITSQGEALDLFSHDSEGRLISHTDPQGAITQFTYNETFQNELNQHVLQKTTLDPLGNATLETYDALNHLIHIEKKNPQQEIVSREEQLYDRSGNLAKRISHVYLANQPTKTIATVWEYDSQGHPILQIEAGQKTTRFTYDCRGRLATRTLPSDITLSYAYDSLGRTTELISSDQTIHYQYLYDTGPDPIQVLDLIQNIHLERSYNRFGQLLQERTPHTFLQWHYDQQGRCTQLTLPDSSSIAYLYAGKHLTAIQRHSTAELLYEHRYTQFDPNGHVAQEELIHQIGLLQTSRDLLERPTSQTSPFLTHSIAYNLSSLVTQTQNSLLGDKHYTYDALDQLLSEGDHDYLFDSMGNPADCKTDDCNQLLSTPHAKIDYDPNGNPINRTHDDISTTYTYDALGRLTSLTTPTRKVSYSYDAFSRLLSKTSSFYTNDFWFDEGVRFYLYDQGYEIGSLNSKGQLQELKVLGLGIKGDIGAAVAVELNHQVYVPLHDFGGSIIALISSSGELIETYRLDAFGREPCGTQLCPWRFCSKRSDEGLIFFGQRHYDPSLCRWLTPDPSGFADGPNLYLYVLNSPLNRLDLFGLSSEFIYQTNHIYFPVAPFLLLPRIDVVFAITGHIGLIKADFMVWLGHSVKFQFSPQEIQANTFDVMTHLHEVPMQKGMISLITAQNGILTSEQGFQDMCQSIVNKAPEASLFIGLYNPSHGWTYHMENLSQEFSGEDTPIVSLTRQFFIAIATNLHKISPEMLWLHISHSEGGLIAHESLARMTPDQQALMKQHLYSFSLGPARPISTEYAFKALNVYSRKDKVTKGYADNYLNNPNYKIKFLKCISTKEEMGWFTGDHWILGTTYQTAIHDNFRKLRNEGKLNYVQMR